MKRCLVALVGAIGLLAGCGTGPVEVRPPQPDADAARACARLLDRLPQRLEGQPRRKTQPDAPFVVAWGSPAIVLRCGVGEPSRLTPTSRLAVVNGVEWFPERSRSSMRFTAVHRAARVELLLPREYAPAAGALVDLAAPIKKAIPPLES